MYSLFSYFVLELNGIRYSTLLCREDFSADRKELLRAEKIISHYDAELNFAANSEEKIPTDPMDFISFFQERYSVYLTVLYCDEFESVTEVMSHTKEAYTPESLRFEKNLEEE